MDTTPKHKPLSELTLQLPNVHSWKAYTSHARDIAFHSYLNEPALFTMEVPDGYPSPITLLLRSPDKSTIASCVPTSTQGSNSYSWDIIIPGPKTTSNSGSQSLAAPKEQWTSTLHKLSKEQYALSIPFLQSTLPLPSSSSFSSSSTTLLSQTQQNSTPNTLLHWHKQTRPPTSTKPPTFSTPDWKLINASTQEVHAVFIEKWDVKYRGSIQFRRSFGREWEVSVVLSVGFLVEEGRRRRYRRGNFAMGMALAG